MCPKYRVDLGTYGKNVEIAPVQRKYDIGDFLDVVKSAESSVVSVDSRNEKSAFRKALAGAIDHSVPEDYGEKKKLFTFIGMKEYNRMSKRGTTGLFMEEMAGDGTMVPAAIEESIRYISGYYIGRDADLPMDEFARIHAITAENSPTYRMISESGIGPVGIEKRIMLEEALSKYPVSRIKAIERQVRRKAR